ncbi:unnamed protein product [Amoebophrya sp. A25]|nr:unnamed protein product [Amoebophrya sp. A25]|eukprot:GSA25T00001892001.1
MVVACNIDVGTRLCVGGAYVTVRWGPDVLPGQGNEQWFGIEYDEAGRGKHNGVHNGIQRFVCPEKSGSFVKVAKVSAPLDFQRALEEKYTDENIPLEFHDHAKARSRPIEFVGREQVVERLGAFQSQGEINLSEASVGDASWRNCLEFPNLQRLSLDWNLITRWATLHSIYTGCPKLEFLSLTGNRLRLLHDDDTSCAGSASGMSVENEVADDAPSTQESQGSSASDTRISATEEASRAASSSSSSDISNNISLLNMRPCLSLKALVLNQTGVRWEGFPAALFPNLEELHLRGNGWTEVPSELPDRFPALRHLQLEDNLIAAWPPLLQQFRRLTLLRHVDLSGNQLPDVNVDVAGVGEVEREEDKGQTTFLLPESLTSFSVARNRIAEWRTVAWLAKRPLKSLVVQENPLAASGQAQALRQILIAVMPSVMRLNASEITSRERANAERLFLSLAGNASIAEVMCVVDPAEKHRKRLEAIHGEGLVYQQNSGHAGGSAFGASLLEVRLQPVAGCILDLPALTKKVPGTLSVEGVKAFCHNCFQKRLPAKKMRLSVVNPGDPVSTVLQQEDDPRELCFYAQNGAEIQIDELEIAG